MKSILSLGIGRMEIDWGKNHSVTNYYEIFKPEDLKLIPCYYVGEKEYEPIMEMQEGYSRKLLYIKRRLDILGYDLNSIKHMYEETVKKHEAYGTQILLDFYVYCDVMKTISIKDFDTVKYENEGFENGYDLGEYVSECIFECPEIQGKIPKTYENDDFLYSQCKQSLAFFLETLNPYIT